MSTEKLGSGTLNSQKKPSNHKIRNEQKRDTKYWIIVASKDHVQHGVEQGVAQACHGKASPLKRMKKGDYVLYYSSKVVFDHTEKCQEFTAIGQVKDDEVYAFQMSEDFTPFRRNIDFFPCTAVSILPLIADLDFIQNKQHWGYPFRYGLLEISAADYAKISSKMLSPSANQSA